MGGTSSANAGRRYRRARRLRHARRGVVAVIGTLLALLVFFALFGIFLTQYLPLWMTDNEAQFTAYAANSFAELKSNIDLQYSIGGPQSSGTAFTISSDSVPLLAQPTEGTLQFLPQTCPSGFYAAGTSGHTAANLGQPVTPSYCNFANVSVSAGGVGSGKYFQTIATGILQFVLPNRYYTPETFYYQADGVVESQSSGYQVMAFPPPLNATYLGGNVTVSTSFLQLYGNATTVLGQGSSEVSSHLRYTQAVTGAGGATHTTFTFTYEIGTQYPCAWSNYLVKLLANSGIPGADYNFKDPLNATVTMPYTGSCFNPSGTTTVLAFSITTVNYVTIWQAGVQLGLGVGGN
jgi:hypothetical protein